MSSYTTEVRYICEYYAGEKSDSGFTSIDKILDKCVDKIFDFTFPIFDESYRIPLEKKILKHFYTREICEETVGLWKLRLEETLDEIMPYYNQLYLTQLSSINPWYNVDLKTEHTGSGTKQSDARANAEKSRNKTENDNTSYDGIREHTESNENDQMTKGTIKTVNYGGDKITKENGTEGGWSKNIQDTSKSEKEKTTNKNTNKSEQNAAGNSTENKTNRYSDTPQGSLQNMNNIKNNLYLTNATLDDTTKRDSTTTKGTITDNGSQDSSFTGTGKTTDNYT